MFLLLFTTDSLYKRVILSGKNFKAANMLAWSKKSNFYYPSFQAD